MHVQSYYIPQTMQYHLIPAARIRCQLRLRCCLELRNEKWEREKRRSTSRPPHLTNLCYSLFMSVGYIFPQWNAFDSPFAPVTIRFQLHSQTHTHPKRQTHGRKFIVVYEMNTGILLNAFQMHIIRFGMFHSYIIRQAIAFLFVGACISPSFAYILFKFPKLPRRGPNTKLNLFILFTLVSRNSIVWHRFDSVSGLILLYSSLHNLFRSPRKSFRLGDLFILTIFSKWVWSCDIKRKRKIVLFKIPASSGEHFKPSHCF